MRRLYVLRHGIAVPYGTPGIADDDRRLTARGERRIGQVALGLRRLRVKPDRILTSPLPRARRTAEIVAEALGVPGRLEVAEALRADRNAAAIREWLVGVKGASVMIVGHNPAFSELVSVLPIGRMAPGICELRKGGLAAFEVDEGPNYRLRWLATPRLLRRVAR